MAKNTIKLKKYLDIINEYEANAAITPGMLIEVMSTGKVRAHATAGGNILPMIALEDELQGNGIDDDYAAADQVQCWVPVRGEEAYLILEDGETAVIGSLLESAGNGNVQVHVPDKETVGADSSGNRTTIYGNQIVGIALEAKNLAESSGGESSGLMGNQRIAVRIL